jgi:ABC-type glycerol-3-phosphate transport system substrate-binding protein
VGSSIEDRLIREFAQYNTPDVLIVRHDRLLELRDFIQRIPLDMYAERTFKDSFISAADVYWRPNGPLAIPFGIDPLVMYWNRNMFADAGFAQPPSSWEEIPEIVNKITERDFSGNIERSAIAFGEYSNVTNAKAIISTLFQQAGNEIMKENKQGKITPRLNRSSNIESAVGGSPASVLNFYTNFSDPSSQLYSWNRSLNDSRDRFIAEDLGMYFGFASEGPRLRKLNPNLNFGVAPVPRARKEGKSVYGRMYALAIVQRTGNKRGVLQAIKALTAGDNTKALAQAFDSVSLRRSHISKGSSNALASVAYESALIADVWPDPNQSATDTVFEEMINNITSGRQSINNSLRRANNQLKELVPE